MKKFIAKAFSSQNEVVLLRNTIFRINKNNKNEKDTLLIFISVFFIFQCSAKYSTECRLLEI